MASQTDLNPRFFRMMAIGMTVAGLAWLGLSLYNARRGGRFNWTGLTLFLVLVGAMWAASARPRRG